MSGGVRNVTYRDSRLGQGPNSRGIDLKPSVGRGGYLQDIRFINVETKGINLGMGGDGEPLMPNNNYVPLMSGWTFINISSKSGGCNMGGCAKGNRSQCFGTVFRDMEHMPRCKPPPATKPLPPQTFGCKRTANTLFGHITLPWGVCLPLDAPVITSHNNPCCSRIPDVTPAIHPQATRSF